MSELKSRTIQRLKETKYRYIVAWGRYLSSSYYYIEDQIDLAEADGAPEDALFKQQDGTWATFDSVVDPQVEAWLRAFTLV